MPTQPAVNYLRLIANDYATNTSTYITPNGVIANYNPSSGLWKQGGAGPNGATVFSDPNGDVVNYYVGSETTTAGINADPNGYVNGKVASDPSVQNIAGYVTSSYGNFNVLNHNGSTFQLQDVNGDTFNLNTQGGFWTLIGNSLSSGLNIFQDSQGDVLPVNGSVLGINGPDQITGPGISRTPVTNAPTSTVSTPSTTSPPPSNPASGTSSPTAADLASQILASLQSQTGQSPNSSVSYGQPGSGSVGGGVAYPSTTAGTTPVTQNPVTTSGSSLSPLLLIGGAVAVLALLWFVMRKKKAGSDTAVAPA